ncbi:HK97 gp10 family phage protein [Sporosarcina cyprini]|uniref:HK97 gp10 family phage protein n=1 Tax=Sporosarcina cyprini TaxID=2910523 RepID=UPI001EDF42B6|nr:HK97 gp10 family phage protein [Sporosarcina cyprini]MCG3089134.1 HK97 gp10 family phage protein [Sporosarcina cyprini]
MSGLEFEGLSDFQKDLLEIAQVKLPRETIKMMRKVGNRANTHIKRVARAKVKSKTGTYYKRFKRGKVFKDGEGKWVVRVINSAPHAHLIEHGHRQVIKTAGVEIEVGFTPGKKVMDTGAKNFESSGDFEKIISKELDRMLEEAGL